MNYDALMAFRIFAEHLNFTHAARVLYVSQPALHAKVNKLADELGVRLYARRGRDLVLTEAGHKLAAHARQIASLSEDVLADLREDERGPVTLASGNGAFMHLLGPAIYRAREGPHPLRLLTMNSTDAAIALVEARAHVAVGVFHAAAPEGLEMLPLRKIGQMVVMPEAHRLASRTSLKPEDLSGERLVIAPAGTPHRRSTAQVLEEHGVLWEVAVEATGWDLMMRFVDYGMGITIINDFVPVAAGLVGLPIEGFPVFRYEVALLRDTPHEGAQWLREVILTSDPE